MPIVAGGLYPVEAVTSEKEQTLAVERKFSILDVERSARTERQIKLAMVMKVILWHRNALAEAFFQLVLGLKHKKPSYSFGCVKTYPFSITYNNKICK